MAHEPEPAGEIVLYRTEDGRTRLGTYNPDWAVLVERDGAKRLYLVVEAKGGLFLDALRPGEQAKID